MQSLHLHSSPNLPRPLLQQQRANNPQPPHSRQLRHLFLRHPPLVLVLRRSSKLHQLRGRQLQALRRNLRSKMLNLNRRRALRNSRRSYRSHSSHKSNNNRNNHSPRKLLQVSPRTHLHSFSRTSRPHHCQISPHQPLELAKLLVKLP